MKNKKNIYSLFILGIVMIIATVPIFIFADIEGSNDGSGEGGNTDVSINTKIDNPFKFKQDTIKGLIETIVNDILLPIGGVIAVLMIMYAGFLFVTARGNETKITKAKDALLYAVIGAAILLGAWVISESISATIDQLKVNK